jgi:hypothetical protein
MEIFTRTESLPAEFQQRKMLLEQNLNEKQNKLNSNMREIAEQQFQKFRVEIAKEFPHFPTELKNLWMEGNVLALSKSYR